MLEQHTIVSSCGEYTRELWLLPSPSGSTHRLGIFLDAEYYLRDMQSPAVIEELTKGEAIAPITCVFVSHVGRDARHQDFACNERYSRFIAEDVVTWVLKRDDRIAVGDHLICGVSLSGLASAYISFLYPSTFSRALCQSGSFWWLADHDVRLPSTNAKFWLSVGSEETAMGISHPPTGMFQRISQIEGVESAVKRFEALGATVKLNLYSGGHSTKPWSDELVPALQWLIGTTL